ncbi:MAG TPA: RuBisCO large subunit C-terminal-like domain-containing protein [bacterium]|nr:RuBisCO large subunit C-terminal-like domain-containing protein [bacterium]
MATELFRRTRHPYNGRSAVSTAAQSAEAVAALNKGRVEGAGLQAPAVRVTYWFEVVHAGAPMGGLVNAARMVLEHGTLKPWHAEGDASVRKPDGYDDFMSWAEDVRLLDRSDAEGVETGLVTIAYPLRFFDKRDDKRVALSQLFMAMASEPFSAFSFYQGARIVEVAFPLELLSRFPQRHWPHSRVRRYLGVEPQEPIIGTIVKPKTGLTPELFSRSVVEAAQAGARFTKADENMHLTLAEMPKYVGRVVKDLERAGFDLAPARHGTIPEPRGRRFLFAPHITTDADRMKDHARAAVEAGANALMFSPYYGGGFPLMAEISSLFDVPVYAHTAGMNVTTGSPTWGLDPRITYVLAGLYGAAFMQLTTLGGYLKPDDAEKGPILAALRAHGLEGAEGMTLAIAGGLGPTNIGKSMRDLGTEGRMFLAGTSVYSHPDGPSSGVKAIICAYEAYVKEGIVDEPGLGRYAESRGGAGKPLARALGRNLGARG